MIATARVMLASLILASSAAAAAAQTDDAAFADYKRQWSQGRYGDVVPLLAAYRRTAPNGRRAEVDYMLATSECRIAGLQPRGYARLLWMLENYKLGPARMRVSDQARACMRVVTGSADDVDFVSIHSSGGASVSGKMGMITERPTEGSTGGAITEVPEVPIATIRARRADKDSIDRVSALLKGALPMYDVRPSGRFLVVQRAGTAAAATAAANALNTAAAFFERTYGMAMPDQLITVFPVATQEELSNVARRLHGLRTEFYTIGYSVYDDLSIAGIAAQGAYGTLVHELFHTLVRGNFGDMPPWLEEGMAAAYADSRIVGDRVEPNPRNWRGPILRQSYAGPIPSLAQLMKMTWLEMDSRDSDPQRQATNQALACFFVLYLQQRGKLVDVYKALQPVDVNESGADARTRALEMALGAPLATVYADFKGWLQTAVQATSTLRWAQ